MFELDATRAGIKDRWKSLLLIGSALAILTAASLYVLGARGAKPALTPDTPPGRLEGALREGAAEFEVYRKWVTIEDQTAVESENLLGQVTVVVRGTLHNRGNRTLTGVELRAVVSDQDNQIVAERNAVPVPKLRSSLEPGASMIVHVNIDPVPRASVRTNGVILLHGLQFE